MLKETSSKTSSAQTKEIKQEEEIDNEVLTMKKDKTLEDDLLILKNVAFCNCLGQEEFRSGGLANNSGKITYSPV